MTDTYYDSILHHCASIGAKVRTSKAFFERQVNTQPTKRTLDIELGCFHRPIVSKQAWDIFTMKDASCRMCRNSNWEELAELTNNNLANGELTTEQVEELREDHYTIACLRAKANKYNVPIHDMVDIWLEQNGECKRCSSQLYPTASTRSFYYLEPQELEDDEDDENDASLGIFVCPMCKY